jgi:alpha-glucosidase
VWDETRVVDGAPGQSVTIARRKGDEWFVGSITNNDARRIQLPLSFLPKLPNGRRFIATVYADDAAVPTRTRVGVRTLKVGADDVLTLNLPASGGQAIWLSPER